MSERDLEVLVYARTCDLAPTSMPTLSSTNSTCRTASAPTASTSESALRSSKRFNSPLEYRRRRSPEPGRTVGRDLEIIVENHGGTVTNTFEGAETLITEIDDERCRLNYQPMFSIPESTLLKEAERLACAHDQSVYSRLRSGATESHVGSVDHSETCRQSHFPRHHTSKER